MIAEYYGIPVSSSLVNKELKTVLLNSLISKGVFNLLASVESPGLVAGAMAAVPSGKGCSEMAEPLDEGRCDPRVGEVAEQQPISFAPGVKSSGIEGKPFTLPQLEPLSVESSSGSRLDARLKVHLARLQLETQ